MTFYPPTLGEPTVPVTGGHFDEPYDLGYLDEAGDVRVRVGLPRHLDWTDLERRCAEEADARLSRPRA